MCFGYVASALVGSAVALASPVATTLPVPNFYELHGQGLKITYSISACTGRPYFTYQDSSYTLQFSGDQVRAIGTEVGTLVNVTINLTVDRGGTTFSVLVPQGRLGPDKQPIPIETEGVTTDYIWSLRPQPGQVQLYKSTDLIGEAEFLSSLC
jgi:hypothetical protein